MSSKLRISQYIPKSDFVRNVMVMVGGTAFGQLVTVAASPFLTRMYAPSDFGVLAAYSSVLTILLVLASWRYEMAIPLPEKDRDAAHLVALSLGLVASTALTVSCLILWQGVAISSILGVPAIRPYLWLVPVGIVGAGSYQVFNYWGIRRKAYSRVAQTKVTQNIGQTVAQLAIGMVSPGPAGLLIGQVVGQTAGSGNLARLAFQQDRSAFRNLSWSTMWDMAYRCRRFPLISVFSGVLNTASVQIPNILLTTFFGVHVSGWFALGNRVLGMPLGLIGQSVAQVYLGQASRLAKQDPLEAERLFTRTSKRLAIASVVPIILIGASGPSLFELVFGFDWREAGVYVQLLVPGFIGQMVVTPLSHTFVILERHDLFLIFNVVRLVFTVSSVVLPFHLGRGPTWAVALYSASMFLTYVLAYFMMRTAYRSATNATRS